MKALGILFKYLKYRLAAGHRKGHGIHSPFMFRFVNEVLYGKASSEQLKKVISWHRSLYNEHYRLSSGTHGAGTHTVKKGMRRVSHIARHSAIRPKYGRLLYRVTDFFKPATIIELGTGLGISTAYLAAGNPGARLVTVEGEKERSDYASREVKLLKLGEVEFVNNEFDKFLESYHPADYPLLVFLDGDHRYEATMRYFHQLETYMHHDSVLIVDDIHWSREMEKAWKEIIAGNSSVLSVDLFFMGIVFFREGVVSQDFIINF